MAKGQHGSGTRSLPAASALWSRRLSAAAAVCRHGRRHRRAGVDDTHHSYWVLLGLERLTITSIDAGFLRAPTSACRGSVVGLQALVGTSIDVPACDLLRRLPATANCTHLADLACWAVLHRDRSARWEIAVPDELDAPVDVQISRDGLPVHRWSVHDAHVTAPASLAGRPLMRGFMAWARNVYEGDALLAAIMLQRGMFVARGRRHLVDRGPEPVSVALAAGMDGSCWSYSGDRRSDATGSLNYVEDFTACVRPSRSPPAIATHFAGARR